ncbi:hydrogenase transcriptional regulatory protein hupR1 [mine drainage metagenome]|jgi:two-component system response regulator HupR/HoxA|uniref:Hydrogenase transcriptional regulatory protein hupR1 n=1 Tax=mine drainage metagenome TaxID=410659 RepID=A0A1J5R6W6_9ZZZZ
MNAIARPVEQPGVNTTVLVVDDELRSLEALRRVLCDEFEVILARSAAEAEAVLASDMVQIVLCDQKMPGETGVDFLTRVRRSWPDPVRMIISGYTDAEDIIAGVNEAGIFRYLTKPWQPDELLLCLREASDEFHAQKLQLHLPAHALAQPTRGFDEHGIVHAAFSPMRQTLALAARAAHCGIPVLITGESGTGKELLARAIHRGSERGDKPFVVENCGALPDELLESELFGHKRGAFTGAYSDRLGLFEMAHGGTIFLDEVGETSPSFQVKLLRVLQEREVRPLGAQRTRKVDVRVISATNRDLAAEVAEGRFRRDLYYRLAVFPIHLPPLRDRAMDIPEIAQRILADVNASYRRNVRGFSDACMDQLVRHEWPGNVRQLQNEIQRMVALHDGDAPLPPEQTSSLPRAAAAATVPGGSLRSRIEALETEAIGDSLRRHRGNISRSAAELGLSRVGLRAKIERYGLGQWAGAADA